MYFIAAGAFLLLGSALGISIACVRILRKDLNYRRNSYDNLVNNYASLAAEHARLKAREAVLEAALRKAMVPEGEAVNFLRDQAGAKSIL